MQPTKTAYRAIHAKSSSSGLSRLSLSLPIATAAISLTWLGAIAPSLALSQTAEAADQTQSPAQKQFVEKQGDVKQFVDAPLDRSSQSNETTSAN